MTETINLAPEHLEPPDGSISIHKIKVGKNRGRKEFKGVLDLRDSIKQHGLINPITVSERQDGSYHLIAGESRLQAACKIPWSEIPCYIKTGLSELQEKELELEENLRRNNLSWEEECTLMEQIDAIKRETHGNAISGSKENKGWKLEDTAKLTGKSIGNASQQINFAKKMKERPDIKERVSHLPFSHAMKEFDRILEAEKLERLHAAGKLDTTLDFRLGDARELVKTLESESVDLALWDPPFGIDELEETNSDTKSGKLKEFDNLDSATASKLFDNLTKEMYRVLKPGGHFYIFFSFNNYESFTLSLALAGLELSDVPIIWDKQTSTTIFKGYNFMSAYEPVLYGWKPPKTRRLSEPCKNIIQCKGVSKKGKLHAFEKPVELLAKLIKMSSNLGDTVLDLTAGSGSTLSAAVETGRKPIGFELDKEHYLRALARLEDDENFLKEKGNA